MRKLLFLSICLFLAVPCQAEIIIVDDDGPADFDNIQAAINDANDDDIIVVFPGTYTGPGNRDIDFLGKAITVRSTEPNDWDVVAATVVDGQYAGRGFYFHSGETASSVLAGLTITNGYADYGGGLRCEASSPTIRKCIFSGNAAQLYGGGMKNENSSPIVTGCIFSSNSAQWSGGGMYNNDCSSLVVTNCIFSGNSAYWGGGMENGNSSPAIINCTFSGNSADCGGGIDSYGTLSPNVSNCILWGDSAFTGPEIYGDVSVFYCDVQGGYTGTGNIDVDPCFVDAGGGDYHLQEGSACIDAGTNSPTGGLPETDIEGIRRPLDGDLDGLALADMGAYEFNFGKPVIAVSAQEFNFAAIECGTNPDNQILSISNGGAGTLNWQVAENCVWLQAEPNSGSSVGDVDEVALAVDIAGLSGGQYICELTISDPCSLNSPQTVDVNLVITGPIIELSAAQFEFHDVEEGPNPGDQILTIGNSGGGTLYWEVSANCEWLGVEPNSGRSKGESNEVTLSVNVSGLVGGEYDCELTVSDANAQNSPQMVVINLLVHIPMELWVPAQFGTIQAAIDAADYGDTVIIAQGTYTGEGNRDLDFAGKAITVRSTDPCNPDVVASTIIDCGPAWEGDQHRAFSFHSGEGRSCVVSGLTITNGVADYGSGIYSYNSSPTISHCIITNNGRIYDDVEHGGGIWCEGGSPIISHCSITNNQTSIMGWFGYGGGICCYDSSPVITNCTFNNNLAHYGGGGISCWGGNPVIRDCTFSNNDCGHGSGGIHCSGGSSSISNCTISDNYGGGIECEGGSAVISHCTITGNSLYYYFGAGIRCHGGSPTITHCTITGNTDGYGAFGGGGIACYGVSSASIRYCIIAGNSSHSGSDLVGEETLPGLGGGVYCSSSSPSISNCTIANNWAEDCGGGIHSTSGGPAVTNCILWDNASPNDPEISGDVAVSYSDIESGYLGIGNINVDPCFADPCNGDYHLQSLAGRWDSDQNDWVYDANTSRCIDAGNPGCDLAYEPNDANNVRINMGAYGCTAEASMPPYDWALLSDITNDGTVDFVDFAHLADIYLEQDEQLPADFDRDGDVDKADLRLLTEGWLKQTSWHE